MAWTRFVALLLCLALGAGAASAQETLSPAVRAPAGPAFGRSVVPQQRDALPRPPGLGGLPPPPAVSMPRLFAPPPARWNETLTMFGPALHQGQTDVRHLTGGFVFGMDPRQVAAALHRPGPAPGWSDLSPAPEFQSDVRYFWVRLSEAGSLRMGTNHCTGSASYLVFDFTRQGLARLSYRLMADTACPSVTEAARDIFARYVTIGRDVLRSVRYRTGVTEVVDVTDTGADLLIPIHWTQVGR